MAGARIPKSLHRQLKLHCVTHDTSVMDFVTEAIREKLARQVAVGGVRGTKARARNVMFDLGLSAVARIRQPGESLYLVRFVCGCLGVVARGQMIQRVSSFGLMCSHLAPPEPKTL